MQIMDAGSTALVSAVATQTPWGLCNGDSGVERAYAGGGHDGVLTELTAPDLSQLVHWA
ncbi:MAG: hypothetical protein ACRDTA_17345 [Pseudonocardiaceae bacterium]